MQYIFLSLLFYSNAACTDWLNSNQIRKTTLLINLLQDILGCFLSFDK